MAKKLRMKWKFDEAGNLVANWKKRKKAAGKKAKKNKGKKS